MSERTECANEHHNYHIIAGVFNLYTEKKTRFKNNNSVTMLQQEPDDFLAPADHFTVVFAGLPGNRFQAVNNSSDRMRELISTQCF